MRGVRRGLSAAPGAAGLRSHGGAPPVDATWRQQETVAFLADPAGYGDGRTAVVQVTTHCSIVFLVGAHAYKLKRAIRFASVDYTTRARRARACRAELALNRRTAPALYLGVRTIRRRADGTLGFDGAGRPVDHVVVMRRFDQAEQFDRLQEAGRLTPDLLRALGHVVARFHLAAPPNRGFGGAHGLRAAIEANHRELLRVAAPLGASALPVLRGRALAALAALAPALDRRRDTGAVRRVHGDLRLPNICLFDGRPTLFDCLEFDETLGTIDLLYDLAFLLMDLHMRGGGALAAPVFARYQEMAGDAEAPAVLPLFLSVRAATRCFALAGKALRETDPVAAARRLAEARRHLAASHCFLRGPPAWLAARG
ncbi:MAG: phosphotransferase [Rhodospirillales bacterium]|jgi:aminoglycoside phosphotransferase family enzyme|nr:phosphotransferase [Rhodospirillales bacterium]